MDQKRFAELEAEAKLWAVSPEGQKVAQLIQKFEKQLMDITPLVHKAAQIYANAVEIPVEDMDDDDCWIEKAAEYLSPLEFKEFFENYREFLPHTRWLILSRKIKRATKAVKLPKVKPGPKPGNREERIAARRAWVIVQRRGEMTFEEWSEAMWGSSGNGVLNVPKSTFYSWPKG